MKTICIKLIALATILVTSSCRVHSTQEEFGPSRKQNVAVADFDEIDLSGGLQVVYAEGTIPKVTVEGPEKLMKNVESRELNARLSGASELEASLTGVETIKADLSGASEADLKFNNCGTALLSASGASNVDLSGTIRSLTKNVGTGSNVKEEKLTIGR